MLLDSCLAVGKTLPANKTYTAKTARTSTEEVCNYKPVKPLDMVEVLRGAPLSQKLGYTTAVQACTASEDTFLLNSVKTSSNGVRGRAVLQMLKQTSSVTILNLSFYVWFSSLILHYV